MRREANIFCSEISPPEEYLILRGIYGLLHLTGAASRLVCQSINNAAHQLDVETQKEKAANEDKLVIIDLENPDEALISEEQVGDATEDTKTGGGAGDARVEDAGAGDAGVDARQ